MKLHTEVQGIGELLAGYRLLVPIHQRAFAWTESEVSQLWEDLTRAQIEETEGYFVGPVVLSEPAAPTNRHSVIDGQQRLATISLLFAAVATYLRRHSEQSRAQLLEEEFLGKKDIRTLRREPKLTLGEDDAHYFRELVDSGSTGKVPERPEGRKPSHVLLWEAYTYLYKRIEALAESTGKSWVESLMNLVEFLRGSVEIILVLVGSDQNAFLIFETLNDRGLRLTTSDLLKNHIFSQAGDHLDPVRKDWTEMTASLEAVGGDDVTPTFLRHYWISNREMVRERYLYRKIAESIRSTPAVVELSTGLARSAAVYAALLSPSDSHWRNSTEIRQNLSWLQVFRVVTPRPLLLAAVETMSKNEIQKVIAAVTRWSVRLAIVGGLGSGTVEDAYGRAARRIRKGKLRSVSALRSELSEILPSDEEFRASFANKTIRNRRQARYLLLRLEEKLRQDRRESAELAPNENERQVDLEHVLPRNADEELWGHFVSEDVRSFVDRLGNLTLLRSTENRAVGATSFEAKKHSYSRSDLLLTRELTEHQSWNPEAIANRQDRMARLAVRAWPAL